MKIKNTIIICTNLSILRGQKAIAPFAPHPLDPPMMRVRPSVQGRIRGILGVQDPSTSLAVPQNLKGGVSLGDGIR